MTDYDDLFEAVAAEDSVFADKAALDPLAEPEHVYAREEQERHLAEIISGVHEGYLPTTVSVYGPPGTGKTLTTRRVCQAFADRHESVAVEYVNLKECRSLFSAANEIHLELTGEKLGAYEGLDGVFEGIWTALEDYPEWTVLILDEIDHIRQDSNYDPSDFFYRLLRGEGKLSRGIQLSVWLLSNELLDVDLRLDSRVESAMSDEQVFFPPYTAAELDDILTPRLEQAFRAEVLTADAINYGVSKAAIRWGDARKALRLFRRAGETANEKRLDMVNRACVAGHVEEVEKAATVAKLLDLPLQHFFVLLGAASWTDRWTGEVVQPVTSEEVEDSYRRRMDEESTIDERAIRDIITDLETMGLIETWIESKGRDGRVKQIETTFPPEWIQGLEEEYISQSQFINEDQHTDE